MTKNERTEIQKKSRRSKAVGKGRDGGIHLEGKRYSRLTENCQTKKETLGLHSSNSEKFTVWYSNVDTLANKLQELRALISNASSKPKLIALTEIKHKNKWDINLNELVIPGYNIFSNDLNTNSRGIINYVSQDLTCKQIDFNNNFSEFSVLEIACKENTKLTIGVCYRSPSSKEDNDIKLFDLINHLCMSKGGNLLLLGDFNWPNINWSSWTSSSKSGSELKFIDTLRKIFFNTAYQ